MPSPTDAAFAPHRRLRANSLLLCCAALLGGCALPPLDHRTESSALTPAESQATPLGQAVAGEVTRHPGLSGIHPLENAYAAFAARVHLARTAQRTLDVQYYIWRDDLTGTLLLETLHEAADRGVRVRLLLDDNGIAGLDELLAAMDAHPQVEVRIFNPFVIRHPKTLNFLTDFRRLNRRMHNKSFTADGVATIIGGRNVGDEYFGATNGVLFADLDVIAVGPAAGDVAHDFDRYWSSASAYPVDRLVPPVSVERLQALASNARAVEQNPAATAYLAAVRDLPDVQRMLNGTLQFQWATTRMVSDNPAKALGEASRDTLVAHQLREILGDPQRELDLVSPYFVPSTGGTSYFADMAKRGVAVRVLTNALEATDVAAVHSGYAKRRKALLEAGVDLYELRRSAAPGKKEERAGPFGSSGSSLHAKTFAVDGTRVFVGSFNFDPRSATINTELGFVIDSPELAGRIESTFASVVPSAAYQVRLDETGKLYWLERRDDEVIRHDTEPNTSWWRRLSIWFMSILPIESML
ncbi:phospholipase D [Cupriavidus necator N-1]|uniref:Phospholipase D n=1 Tax=Cupriavidus necator (strain ATCC 43291 / DSM 13513 / CCUG 52238 / LMG 8453 / N-1) TaxID=1042878 RepID=F8GTS8_CUPNN|nr:phospholipase D family protein [Cupriavidus necator]AEI80035.1 phospholipase D [Cupriavidus necator N-1]KAI3599326.1 Cardiolipin synthase phosphatidylethanolamine-utilizing, bacterial type ClsC [Cupriavidus necator H850]MDX6010330.1 phospholipase D family protein [Cupriavidus necator]